MSIVVAAGGKSTHSPASQRTEEIGWARFSSAEKTGIKGIPKPGTLSNISCLFAFLFVCWPETSAALFLLEHQRPQKQFPWRVANIPTYRPHAGGF